MQYVMHVILDIRPFRFSACDIKMLVKAWGRDYVCVIGVVKGGGSGGTCPHKLHVVHKHSHVNICCTKGLYM